MKGSKVDPDQAQKLDPGRIGSLTEGSLQQPDVEGQTATVQYCQCPWCGWYGRVPVGEKLQAFYTCGGCGKVMELRLI
jgi:hypothetical protein